MKTTAVSQLLPAQRRVRAGLWPRKRSSRSTGWLLLPDFCGEASIGASRTPETFFRTSELIARRFALDDLADFLALRCDPEVARYQDWESFTEAEAGQFIAAQRERHPGEPGWFQFALAREADGVFVGDCGLRILESDHRLAQIGYTIVPSYWGRGYATAVVRALVEYAFGTFPVHRLTASVDPRNTPSVRVLEKAGFAKEAHFRESYWFKGDWADDAIYAILAP